MLNVLLEGEADSVAPSEREAIQIIHVLYSILRHFEFDKQNTLLNHVILTGGTLCKLLSSSKCDASGENVSDQEFNLVKMLERVKLAMERITGISEFASDLQPRLSAIQFRKIPDYFKSSISTRTPSLEESPLISDSALMSTENASFLDTVFFGACLAARLVYADNRYFISRAEYNSFGPKISWAKLLMN